MKRGLFVVWKYSKNVDFWKIYCRPIFENLLLNCEKELTDHDFLAKFKNVELRNPKKMERECRTDLVTDFKYYMVFRVIFNNQEYKVSIYGGIFLVWRHLYVQREREREREIVFESSQWNPYIKLWVQPHMFSLKQQTLVNTIDHLAMYIYIYIYQACNFSGFNRNFVFL